MTKMGPLGRHDGKGIPIRRGCTGKLGVLHSGVCWFYSSVDARYVAWNDCWPGCGGVMASRWHPGLDPWPHSSMCCKPMIGSETNNHSQPMRNHYLLLERDET